MWGGSGGQIVRSGGQGMRWPPPGKPWARPCRSGAEALEGVRHGERLLQEDQALRICVN